MKIEHSSELATAAPSASSFLTAKKWRAKIEISRGDCVAFRVVFWLILRGIRYIFASAVIRCEIDAFILLWSGAGSKVQVSMDDEIFRFVKTFINQENLIAQDSWSLLGNKVQFNGCRRGFDEFYSKICWKKYAHLIYETEKHDICNELHEENVVDGYGEQRCVVLRTCARSN